MPLVWLTAFLPAYGVEPPMLCFPLWVLLALASHVSLTLAHVVRERGVKIWVVGVKRAQRRFSI